MSDDFCLQAYAAARAEQRFRLLSAAAGALAMAGLLSWGPVHSAWVAGGLGMSSSVSLLAAAWFFWRSGSVGFSTVASHDPVGEAASDDDASADSDREFFTEAEMRNMKPRAVRWHSLMFALVMAAVGIAIGAGSAAVLALAISTRS